MFRWNPQPPSQVAARRTAVLSTVPHNDAVNIDELPNPPYIALMGNPHLLPTKQYVEELRRILSKPTQAQENSAETSGDVMANVQSEQVSSSSLMLNRDARIINMVGDI